MCDLICFSINYCDRSCDAGRIRSIYYSV